MLVHPAPKASEPQHCNALSSLCLVIVWFSFLFEQVVERKRTAAEIREEFERLQREREERRLQQRTNPKVSKDLILVSRMGL